MKAQELKLLRKDAEAAWQRGEREYTLNTMVLLRLLDGLMATEEMRQLAAVASTYVGREPMTDEGVESAGRVKQQLRKVWKGK